MQSKYRFLSMAAAAALLLAPALHAKTFKWTSQSEVGSWDIHTQNISLQNGLHAYVYESLVYYNSRTFAVEPALASSWKEISPTQVRFALRPDVKFHDGSAFSADDAVFSLQRAMARTSAFALFAQGIGKVVKVDSRTIDIFLSAPNPVLLRQLTELRIMSRSWAQKNQSLDPKELTSTEENFAHRNAMGTGPYMLESWQPDVKMVFKRNPHWWGTMEGDVSEMVYLPIKSAATRIAALLSGEVDMVLDPAPQDLARLRANPEMKVVDGLEFRTILLGMDQFREELPGSNIQGRNPLKDVRVRRALYQAIDAEAIARSIMRGLGRPNGTLVAPMVAGYTEAVGKRLPYSVEAAKKLLAEAGYPDGFEVDFACPNNRYINDEAICQAVTAMWSRVGVRARLRTLPLVSYFPMVKRYEASIYMLGWGVATFDALNGLQSLVRTKGESSVDGNNNMGRYSHPRMDYLVDRIKVETDAPVRARMLTEALQLSNDTVSHIPLHDQVIPWAMKRNVDLVHRADNRVDIRMVRVN
ncbi:ABC transporter substrate-binding protein [Verminephrobacter aporrectodeae subsp. tuberculatae]|uniref:ABC transporter substrate-binding protein n=2 Tax=Verminephrobacter TaxID=364316 RepID=A0ABT3KWS9_9BURK|nr:ABC transporter substrate-binding protein [Verminephrobacter aporrectodeae]MCW5322265.1 ABC transporter substrate-binding protein [Verminephrobacter aporrectodeae subsp. tuberculatae]